MIRRSNGQLDAEARVELATLIGNIAWAGSDALPVLSALSDSRAEKVNRRPQQEFKTFLELGAQRDWNTIDAASKPLGTLNAIQSLLARLSGRCLDEHSLKLGNSLWMMVCDPDINNKDYIHKQSKLSIFKKEFKRRIDKMQDPPEYIEKLPETPAELANQFPGVFAMQFCGEIGAAPMRCPYSIDSLMELDSSYRCRGAGKDAFAKSQSSIVQVGSDGCNSMDSQRK